MQALRRRMTCASPPANGGVLSGYLRAVEPLNRGPLGVGVFVAAFIAALAVGGRAGLLLASTWLLFVGTWCLGNFWQCRETHCGVTGPGWTLTALVGFAAALASGGSLEWFSVSVEILLTLGILGLGYGLEAAVAASTGRRALR
jgi:hypothetical protein